jgi:RNA polymerase sigma-70 factor (sigma-E family)
VRDSGDPDGFEPFMAAALPGLLRFGHVLTGNPHEAEELAQEALMRTCARWRRIRHDEPVAYVRRTMVNAWISRWRRRWRETRLPDGWDAAGTVDAPVWDERERTLTALRTLPPRQRAVVVLRYYDDLSEAQIADVLGCSVGTVKSHASRALATLRRVLEETTSDAGALR